MMCSVSAKALVKRDRAKLQAIDQIMDAGIRARKIPGGVVIAGHNGRVIFHKAYGMRSLVPTHERMTEGTVFDLASLTKPIVTATAIMQLVEKGDLRLNDPVAQYLPEFGSNNKQDITIRELLTHYSGLASDLSLAGTWRGKQEGLHEAVNTLPIAPPGTKFRYSDLNFIVLGALVEKVAGLSLEAYTDKYIAAPLGLKHTRFLPPGSWRTNTAPTQYDDHGVMLRGVVHDPTARRMGGMAGHAGLFSTAGDLSIYAQNLLDCLAGRANRFPLRRRTLEKMTSPNQPPTGTALRGLGWDIESPFSSNRGELFPVGSFGHTGFTGTSLWIDPASDTYVVILANAVHTNGPTGINSLRAEIANVVAARVGVSKDNGNLAAGLTGYNEAASGVRRLEARNGNVKTGIDVLEANNFSDLAGLPRKQDGILQAGLLTNQTGLDAHGRRTADVLARDAQAAVPGFRLKLLFSPEHGINGELDTGNIRSGSDAATGLPILSLYGATDADRRPTIEAMRSLDVVVIDLQDAGVRFYTYETVVRYFLEAAARTGTAIVVLDRPNPVTGSFVQGPISDIGSESYVNSSPIPVRHGMTLGELSRYFNGELKLKASLIVVKMSGWQRGDWFDSTDIEWVNPSPNLRNLDEMMLYPAAGLIETTNISVGRGTDTPFEMIGAPWIDARELSQYLNNRDLPGVRFIPTSFTPQGTYPYAGQRCQGIELLVTARDFIDSPELGLEIAAALHELYGSAFHLDKIQTLLANASVLNSIQAKMDPQRIEENWEASLQAFLLVRKKYLLY